MRTAEGNRFFAAGDGVSTDKGIHPPTKWRIAERVAAASSIAFDPSHMLAAAYRSLNRDYVCVVDLMPDQVNITDKGGTMRLGKYPCLLTRGSISRSLYGSENISERHRHRYELNYDSEGREAIEKAGLVVSGTSPDGKLVEIVELPDHPYFIAGQFHPEFKSRPNKPHPLFVEFIRASIKSF